MGLLLPGGAVFRRSSGVAGSLVLHSLQKQNCSAARRAVPVALWWRWGWIAPGRSALGGWAACSVYYDLGGKFAPMAAPLLSLSSSPPLDSLTGSLRALGLGWIGSAARSPAGRGWSAGRGWRLVVWLGGAVAALAAACLLRSCSVVPALPLACLSACTGAGCSALPSGLAPTGLRRGAAVLGGQAGRWAGMIPLGWWAGAGDSRSSYCIILCLVFRHFSPLSVRLATHKMIDKYP